MSLYKLKRELFRVCMNAAVVGPFPREFKLNAIRYWKEHFCMTEGFDCQHPLPDLPHSEFAKVLDLSCTSGFGQTVHPDVIYTGGWGLGKWKYLMTITGFPFSNDYYENPEFLVSSDGIDWRVPESGRSPLVKFPAHVGYSYNSDPALLYDREVVYLFYREVRRTGRKSTVALCCISSADGVSWSGEQRIMSASTTDRNPAILMSPALLRLHGRYVMWYVEKTTADSFEIMRTESSELDTLQPGVKVLLNGLEGRQPWHLDVAEDGGRLLMALCTADAGHEILFAESRDMGLTWNVCGERLMPDKYAFGGCCLYKPALCRDDSSGWRLYYSAQTETGIWLTAVTEVRL